MTMESYESNVLNLLLCTAVQGKDWEEAKSKNDSIIKGIFKNLWSFVDFFENERIIHDEEDDSYVFDNSLIFKGQTHYTSEIMNYFDPDRLDPPDYSKESDFTIEDIKDLFNGISTNGFEIYDYTFS